MTNNNGTLSYIAEQLRGLAAPISTLLPDPANVRKHSTQNLEAIKNSLERFGQQKPIVSKADGTVIAGNGTLTAAQALGWTHLAVVSTTLEGHEATAFALADNRTAELAAWDFQELAETFTALSAAHCTIEGLGWQAYEYEPLLQATWTPPPVDPTNTNPARTDKNAHVADKSAEPSAAAKPEPVEDQDGDDQHELQDSPATAAPAGPASTMRMIEVTAEQYAVITSAVEKVREIENDLTISAGRALELIAADFLAGY